MSTTPTAAILVIGNEILSGRTHDINVKYIAECLKKVGIQLLEVRIIPDVEAMIIETVNALRKRYVYVFTTGGIGATHDDITAASVAKAFNRALIEHEGALAALVVHYQERLNDNRRRMALMPADCGYIANPVSGAWGFFVENVYCLAGMPSVMQAMFNEILPTLKGGAPFISQTITCDLVEGDIAHALAAIQENHPSVQIGSYPFYRKPPDIGVSFVVQGQDKAAVLAATDAVNQMVIVFGGTLFKAESADGASC